MEEDEEEQDTSIKGRLLTLVYKIKGQPQKTEKEPTEEEQAAPCKDITVFVLLINKRTDTVISLRIKMAYLY